MFIFVENHKKSSTSESAGMYMYRLMKSKNKYCIYHILICISCCFDNYCIKNFTLRLEQSVLRNGDVMFICMHTFSSIYKSYKLHVTGEVRVYVRWALGPLSFPYYILLIPLPLSGNIFKLFDKKKRNIGLSLLNMRLLI